MRYIVYKTTNLFTPSTGETRMVPADSILDMEGWIKGNPNPGGAQSGGTIWVHNPKANEVRRIRPEELQTFVDQHRGAPHLWKSMKRRKK